MYTRSISVVSPKRFEQKLNGWVCIPFSPTEKSFEINEDNLRLANLWMIVFEENTKILFRENKIYSDLRSIAPLALQISLTSSIQSLRKNNSKKKNNKSM